MVDTVQHSDGPFEDPPERRRIRHAVSDVGDVHRVIIATRKTASFLIKSIGVVAGLAVAVAEITKAWHAFFPT